MITPPRPRSSTEKSVAMFALAFIFLFRLGDALFLRIGQSPSTGRPLALTRPARLETADQMTPLAVLIV